MYIYIYIYLNFIGCFENSRWHKAVRLHLNQTELGYGSGGEHIVEEMNESREMKRRMIAQILETNPRLR